MNFSIDYSWHKCGGVLDNPDELTSPGWPGRYPPNTHCAWKLIFDEGKQALVSVASPANELVLLRPPFNDSLIPVGR